METKKDASFFTNDKVLIRCIVEANRSGNRVSSVAFERRILQGKLEEYLSLSCEEITDFKEITKRFHKVIFKEESNFVFSVSHKVKTYTSAANKAKKGLIKLDKGCQVYEFSNQSLPAYINKPTPNMGKSHCGAMFVKALDKLTEKIFSQKMANKSVGKLTRTKIE